MLVAMRFGDWVVRLPPVRKVNSAWFHYRTHRWRWHPRFRIDDPSVEIDRPIFLLGTQGGGLTLLSRILRRLPNVVSATGNHRYWAGYDELQDVLYDALPPQLRLHALRLPGSTPELRGWIYASELFFDQYHEDASSASAELEAEFKRMLRGLIRMNRPRGVSSGLRFLDKSQSFAVRVGLVAELLRDCQPRFVLVTRDPFAMCWRAVQKVAGMVRLDLEEREKVRLAAQHWKNTMETALNECGDAPLAWWRFEDFLAGPERVIREICAFAELDFDPAILPGPEDRIPFGSMYDAFDRSKWYPIRPPVNRPYLETIPAWAVEEVASSCGELVAKFGYGVHARG
jgi:hypothetical protein